MTAIVQQVQEKAKGLKHIPAVAHVFRMNTRYTTRLGNQFAGAITYFSLLAMVPILAKEFAQKCRPEIYAVYRKTGTNISGKEPEGCYPFSATFCYHIKSKPAVIRWKTNLKNAYFLYCRMLYWINYESG